MPSTDTTAARVLLVDDDELSLELVAMLLEAENYTVTRAGSGEEAIKQLQAPARQVIPDILLLDLQMPGLCGQELAEKCRSLVPDSTLILAMSATRPPASRLTRYDGFVSKPFSMVAFQLALDRVAAGPGFMSAEEAGRYGRDLDDSVYGKLAAMMPATRLNEIYATCLADTARRIPVMQKLSSSGDLVEIRRIAHAIKGGGSMIGARSIAEIAAELELGDYTLEDVPRLLGDLSSACGRLGSILLLAENQENKGKA